MACLVMSAATPTPTPASVPLTSLQQVNQSPNLTLVTQPYSLAFVYGTLKQGFSNHWLIREVIGEGHAYYVGEARSKQRFPLVCGPFQVPFLLHMPNSGLQVKGEVYAVDEFALELLDELEGVNKGHYVRHPLVLTDLQLDESEAHADPGSEILAEAYFAHPSLQRGLSSAPHIEAYTKKETVNYVYRKDRPKNRTFLEHVNNWIESNGPVSYIRS